MEANAADQMAAQWSQRYSQCAGRMTSSIIREILKMMADPELIPFSGGMPAPEVFPVQAFQEASQRVLEAQGPVALQYGVTEGYPPLRQFLAQRMQEMGVRCAPENILIINGSQQALDFIGKLFVDPGDRVLTGNPTYLGALQSWGGYGARYATATVDAQGMRPDEAEAALASHPAKFLYVLPNFHNPAGVTLSRQRREQLVEVASKHNAFIVEDDPYGELRFEGEAQPPMAALDPDRVLYLSTFSKTLSPGIRLGWIAGPKPVIDKMVQIKQASDLHTSVFVQMIAYDLCSRGFLPGHIRHIQDVYRERRDAMLAAMKASFPQGVTWNKPEGGLFLWLQLPAGLDGMALLKQSLKAKVAFVPGQVFYPNGGGENTLRLNFSAVAPPAIREGIQRLGGVLREALG